MAALKNNDAKVVTPPGVPHPAQAVFGVARAENRHVDEQGVPLQAAPVGADDPGVHLSVKRACGDAYLFGGLSQTE